MRSGLDQGIGQKFTRASFTMTVMFPQVESRTGTLDSQTHHLSILSAHAVLLARHKEGLPS